MWVWREFQRIIMKVVENYFELFNLPVSFDIDKAELATRYRHLQRTTHPDNHVNSSDRERRLALQHTAYINTAYQTLKDALARGKYILTLQGHDIDMQHTTATDPSFLMEQMELRETLATIKNISQLSPFMQNIAERISAATHTLGKALTDNDIAIATTRLHQLQFLTRLHEEAIRLEEDLLDI